MAEHLTVPDMQAGYLDVLDHVIKYGERASPRGMLTYEVLGMSIDVLDTTRCMPIGMNRGVNTALGVAEALQLISGTTYPRLLEQIAPTMKKFMDTLGSSPPYLHGAYGPRVKQAIPNAIAKLQRDSDSRQAVVTIYDAKIDLISTFNDIPCTIALHFLLRHDQLDLHTYMRSNDINWGIAYDVFQFTQLQHTMARCMNVEAGRYTHHATSLHVYEKDLHAAREVRYPTKLMPAITGIGVHTRNDWHHFRLIAEGILTGKLQGFVFTPSEQWMLERMKPYAERMG